MHCKKYKESVVGYIVTHVDLYPYIVDEIFPDLIKAGADPYEKSIKQVSMIEVIMNRNRPDLLRLVQEQQWANDEKALKKKKDAWLYNNSPILKSCKAAV